MNTTQARITRKIAAFERQRDKAQAKINFLAVCRLGAFLCLITGASLMFGGDVRLYGALAAVISGGMFLYLMVQHSRCFRYKSQCEQVLALYGDDLARVCLDLKQLEYRDPIPFEDNHPFAADLDLTGPFSLLKLIDNTFHLRAKQTLSQWLNHADPPETIVARQQAVRDLSTRDRFRLKLALACRMDSQRDLKADDLNEWLQLKAPWTLSTPAWLFTRLTSLAVTVSVIGTFFLNVEGLPWLPLLALQFLLFYGFDMVHKGYYLTFMIRGKAVNAAGAVISTFEKVSFKAPLLQEMQAQLQREGDSAGDALKRLSHLLDMLSYRSDGLAHFLLNIFLMWDQHHLRNLAKWADNHGDTLPHWIETIFKIEPYAALANFDRLFPGRPFPELAPGGDIHITATNLGHPCIPEHTRVGNNYQLEGNGRLHLVTGSNMSGKSTFLRTIGLNLLLARLGAPVCAQSLTCSLPKLMTSIRISDSLADGVSYFYAEVQRLKLILDEIERGDGGVLYLLDEILKGTNSKERLIACKALVQFLIQHKASGLITTHDLELIALESQHPHAILNYHFQETTRGDKMTFDYRLKRGELTSTNALRLMRHAGVPLEFEEGA